MTDAAAGDAWLDDSLAQVRAPREQREQREDNKTLLRCWSAAGRKLGARAEEGRRQLLLAALEVLPDDRHVAIVDRLYRTGELKEQETLLRLLPDLPQPARFVEIGVEAVRNNALSVIEAIACDNPYPARHFSEGAFNQMVMKCLFNEIRLGAVVGLRDRCTEELRRMVAGYVSERRAAGRSVPADAALVLETFVPEALVGGTDAPV